MPSETHKIDRLSTYVVIFVLLMGLLIATVIAAAIDMGPWNTVVSLAIAVMKALLVILFFMHVRHSSRLTWIFAGAAFVWLALLLGLTLTDYTSRNVPTPDSAAQITAAAHLGEYPYTARSPSVP